MRYLCPCIYCKASRGGNLQRQKERLITYAVEKGYRVKAVYNGIASCLNENRRELTKLAKTFTKGEINAIVTEYKDRLARFGYKYLEQYYWLGGIEIDIMESDEGKSPQEELVEDRIAIVTSFSARIYGKRGGCVAKKLTELIKQEVVAGENHG